MRLNGRTNHIWSRDPALNASDEAALYAGLDEHHKSGDASKVPLVEGKQPVLWQLLSLTDRGYASLTRVSHHQVLSAIAGKDPTVLAARAVYLERREAARRGVVGVEGYVDEDGRPFRLDFEKDGEDQVLTQKSIERLHRHFGPLLIGELGQRILDLTEGVGPT